MVYTPRRRRLLRAIFVGLIFTGCVLLFERWNVSGPPVSNHDPRIAKYVHDPLDTIYRERKTTRHDVNVTKVLVINQKKQIKNSDVTDKPNITWIKHPWTSSLRGFLNVHVWLDWCGSTVNDLRRNIHFPNYPDVRLKTKLFHLSHDAHNFGQRVFGFLHPPRTGRYTFAMSSDDSSELWLSSDDDPQNTRLIAWVGNLSDPLWQGIVGDGEFTKYESQISGKIFLRRNRRYFIEALHKQSTSNDHLLVAWKIPLVGNFSHITRGRISQYIHPHELHNLDVTRYARHIPLTPAVLQEPIILQKLQDQIPVDISNPRQNSDTPVSSDARLYRRDDYPISKREQNRKPIGKSEQFSRTGKKYLSDQVNKDSHVKQNLEDFSFDTKFRQSIAHKMYHSCDYNPSYRVDFKVARYEGVYLIHETAVYPDDRTHLQHVEYFKPCYEMRSADSHGQMLPGAEQSEFDERDDSEDGWNEGGGEEGNEGGGEEHLKRHDSDQIIDTGGNIVTVNYRDHRLDSVNKSNFSAGKRFNKRKILAILESRNKNTGNSRYERKSDGTTVTSRLAVSSARSHDNNFQERGIGHGDLKKSENIFIPESNSDESMVKKSAKTTGDEVRNSLETPVNRVGRISNARVNGGSERRISKNTKSKAGIKGKSRESLERPVEAVERVSGIHSTSGRTLNKAKQSENDQMNENFKEQQGLRENTRNNVDSPKHELEKLQAQTLSGTKISQRNSVKEKRITNSTQEIIKEIIKRRRTERRQGDVHNQVRIVGQEGTTKDSSIVRQDNSFSNDEAKLWHRRRRNSRRSKNVFVDDSSPLAMTFRTLQESGQWKEIKEYAKRNGLLLTKKTWMYVTWKFLRYEKPKKPHDKLVEFVYKQNPPKCRTDGNILLNEKVAKGIVSKYMQDLRKRYGSDIYLRRIVSIEENHDIIKGDRYLIELDLGLKDKNETIQVSDYVYLPLGAQSFCSPRHFVWRRNVTVHVIVPVKDQGKWVQHFIDDMSELYETTHDSNVNVIIVDFSSTDIDIERALKQSSLKRYRFLQVNGSFQRALGVQIGADVVENPDDIIFTCDLHLDIPNNMIDVLRKHCIQGKMAFSPMVLRLECGFTPTLPFGEWETMGYGLFAIYKSDFDRIGGMNIDEFKTKWGGEDWEMVDRCLTKGMEIERLRVPKFYHYFHSKQGMWGSYGFEDNVSGSIGDTIIEDELVPVYDDEEDSAIGYSYNQPLMPEY